MFGISGLGTGYSYYQNPYMSIYNGGSVQHGAAAQRTTAAAKNTVTTAVAPAAQPDVPVQGVDRVPAVDPVQLDRNDMLRRWENDPAAMAARDRIEYIAGEDHDQSVMATGIPQTAEQAVLPGAEDATERGSLQMGRSRGKASTEDSAQGVTLPGYAPVEGGKDGADGEKDGKVQLPGQKAEEDEKGVDGEKTRSAQEVMEESECQTCKNRKYQDGSDDPGVSFKSPTHIDPDMAPSQVRGHEMEHVVREQASAKMEDRKVVSQSVTYHTAICPECGRVYVSGGTTRTTTAAQGQEESSAQQQGQEDEEKNMLGIPAMA